MLYSNVSFCQFTDLFYNHDREDQFSYYGKKALFNWYEELSEDQGEDLEVDIIAICCEWAEYDDLEDYNDQHGSEYESVEELSDDYFTLVSDNGSLIVHN